jgi:sigma-B regulation protein RsbU (phosphoserine phosphatase)
MVIDTEVERRRLKRRALAEGARMRVLIAEDDPISRHLLQRTLEQWGYEVVTANDGEEAWRLFEPADFPLVISDWVMPALDGLELVRRIRSASRPGYVYTILLTAKSQKEEVVAGMAAGADDFISKPFDREELRARLRAGERIIRLEEALLAQNRALSERNAEMEADLRMACEVQQAILPQHYPTFPAGAPASASALRFFDRYRPNGAVGGDFFDVLPLSDVQAGVFICDVMGHGVRAALVTAIVRALLEGFRHLAADPGWFLSELNRELMAILGQTSMPVFLSAFYLTLDVTTGELRYANAGHPLPLHVRRSAGEVGTLPMSAGMPGPPLGVREQAVYSMAQVNVAAGDLVVLFTDGVYEGVGPNQEPYGEERLLEAVRKRIELPPGRMFDELLGEVLQYTGSKGFADDVCLLGVEVAALSLNEAPA